MVLFTLAVILLIVVILAAFGINVFEIMIAILVALIEMFSSL